MKLSCLVHASVVRAMRRRPDDVGIARTYRARVHASLNAGLHAGWRWRHKYAPAPRMPTCERGARPSERAMALVEAAEYRQVLKWLDVVHAPQLMPTRLRRALVLLAYGLQAEGAARELLKLDAGAALDKIDDLPPDGDWDVLLGRCFDGRF